MAKTRKISEQQYRRALAVVHEYKSNFHRKLINKIFTIEDLCILTGTISVPYLTMKIVDEDFASNLQDRLERKGYSIDYVSLDDMGHISAHYRGGLYHVTITEKHIEDFLSALNDI